MKFRIHLLALCLLVLLCPAADGQTRRSNDRSADWEYKQLTDPSDEVLNHHAKEGWEIAGLAGGGGDSSRFYRVILKRSRSHPRFGTRTPDIPMPEPTPQNNVCRLTLAQAPMIRGLRLGMTSDEIFSLLPASEREAFERAQKLKSAELPPNYGYTTFSFYTSNYAAGDRFTGISRIDFELFDGKAVSITVNYANAPEFDRIGQLLEVITRQFGLPDYKEWRLHSHYASLSCEGFTFQLSGFSSDFSVSITDPTFRKIREERRQADRARKRTGFTL